MKLKSLYIEDYKNIKQQTFDFSSNTGYIALIGENGSGKSNLLEAISLIFNGIFNKKKIPFDYSIEYEMNGAVYKRKKGKAYKEDVVIRNEDMLYPSSVIACYSGEDMRLWHRAYEDYYNHFFNKAKDENYFVTQMLYVNRYCWQIALISLLCNDSSSDFLKSCLGIDDISKIEISFEYNDAKKDMFKKHDALSWFNRIVSEGNAVNAKTLATTDIASSSATTMKQEKSKTIFQYLFLLSMPKKNDVNKVEKLITKIQIKIGDIDFDDLSEGEKKLILIECITKVLGDENTLILLDEPDAHTHVARKKELLNTIESFEGQTILTTHSPVFVEIMQKQSQSNVFYIENGQINSDKNNLIKNLSAEELNMLDGSLYAKSGMYLLVEGKSDVKCIKEAIKRFNYKKLEDVAVISFNGTSNALEFYKQAFENSMNCINKLVFLFDYDEAGYKAWEDVGSVVLSPDSNGKCERLFYQKDYINYKDPTGKMPNSDSVLLEDLFPASSYQEEMDKITKIKGFHDLHVQGSITEKGIKTYIEKNYKKFNNADFNGFKPLLDKLLELFGLQ